MIYLFIVIGIIALVSWLSHDNSDATANSGSFKPSVGLMVALVISIIVVAALMWPTVASTLQKLSTL